MKTVQDLRSEVDVIILDNESIMILNTFNMYYSSASKCYLDFMLISKERNVSDTFA